MLELLGEHAPDLLVLRSLDPAQLDRAVEVLRAALGEGRPAKAEARSVREALPDKSFHRLRQIAGRLGPGPQLDLVVEGARHSANRAGLVVCGGVAPALAALRAKRALEVEVAELMRFAASERYLELRTRELR